MVKKTLFYTTVCAVLVFLRHLFFFLCVNLHRYSWGGILPANQRKQLSVQMCCLFPLKINFQLLFKKNYLFQGELHGNIFKFIYPQLSRYSQISKLFLINPKIANPQIFMINPQIHKCSRIPSQLLAKPLKSQV
jgi:hypothetical protein